MFSAKFRVTSFPPFSSLDHVPTTCREKQEIPCIFLQSSEFVRTFFLLENQ